jgi:hypothetical protein
MDYGYGTVASVGDDGSNRIDYSSMNKGITPIFFMEPTLDERASSEQGRAVYKETEIVHLHIAGDSCSVHATPVDEAIKTRFPEQYQHWKRTNQGHHISGTPLKMWPPATPVQIKELEAIHVHSVEDLASIADVHLDRIPDGRMWRDKAEAWLKVARDSSTATRFAAENEALKARIEALEKGSRDSPSPKVAKPRVFNALQSEKMKAHWARKKALASRPA